MFPKTDCMFHVIMCSYRECLVLSRMIPYRFLFILMFHRNLQKLSLFGDISILQQHGSISNTYLGKVDPDGKKIKQ